MVFIRIMAAATLFTMTLAGPVNNVAAQQNPFTGGSARAGTETTVDAREEIPGEATGEAHGGVEGTRPVRIHPIFRGQPLFPRMNALLRDQQRALNARFADLIHAQTEEGSAGRPGGMLSYITLVAFLYGLVHAALPGHRKVLLVSYFVSTPARVHHAVLAGVSVAVLHAGAAAAVILSAYYLLRTSLSAAMDSATLYLQAVTAAFVLAIGLVILGLKIREAIQLRRGLADHHESEEAGRLLGFLRKRIGLLPAIVLSAIVPCPGSAMILLFALSLGVVSLGLYAVAIFSFGMAITLSTVLVVTVVSKQVLFRALEGSFGEALHVGIEGLGGLVMVVFGAVLLMPYL
jgi:nickel/cobalt transporter (NicO) family protein